MKKTFCDRCGGLTESRIVGGSYLVSNLDVCDSCREAFKEWWLEAKQKNQVLDK